MNVQVGGGQAATTFRNDKLKKYHKIIFMSCVNLSANAFTEIPETCICTPFQRALNNIIIYKIDTD